ncbi:MAG: YdcF family protein [Gemmatimonadaceae bacterium]|nr:YdcF family protein [Gemmatimonadaceae bacterium]
MSPRTPSRLRRLIGGTLLTVLVGWLLLVAGVWWAGRTDDARPASAIVVFGAAQYAGRPSPVLEARLEHALALHRRGIARRLIVTGGKQDGDLMSEAEAAARWMRRRGVPSSAIITEGASRSTSEQMHAVARIARRRGLDTVVLVSDPYHMLRLRMTAWRVGVPAVGSPTRSGPLVPWSEAGVRYLLAESLKAPVALLLERRAR